MIKTQIQLTEELHRELKQWARRKQWSLAETLRRGAEALVERYPRSTVTTPGVWEPPQSDVRCRRAVGVAHEI